MASRASCSSVESCPPPDGAPARAFRRASPSVRASPRPRRAAPRCRARALGGPPSSRWRVRSATSAASWACRRSALLFRAPGRSTAAQLRLQRLRRQPGSPAAARRCCPPPRGAVPVRPRGRARRPVRPRRRPTVFGRAAGTRRRPPRAATSMTARKTGSMRSFEGWRAPVFALCSPDCAPPVNGQFLRRTGGRHRVLLPARGQPAGGDGGGGGALGMAALGSPTATRSRASCARTRRRRRRGCACCRARASVRDGTPELAAYPTDRAAWGRLTRLLTLGQAAGAERRMLLDYPTAGACRGPALPCHPARASDGRLPETSERCVGLPATGGTCRRDRRHAADDAARLRALARLPLPMARDQRRALPRARTAAAAGRDDRIRLGCTSPRPAWRCSRTPSGI